jgi:endoglucanase
MPYRHAALVVAILFSSAALGAQDRTVELLQKIADAAGAPGFEEPIRYDSSALPNRRLVTFVRDTAAAGKIPLQLDLVPGYGDDSAELQKALGGLPTVNLVVPVRYTHSHNGIINRRDFDQMVDLLVAMLQKLDAPTVKRLRDFTPEP